MTDGSDAGVYAQVLNQAAADMVRGILANSDDPGRSAAAVRAVTSWLAAHHGADAVRDVAELLAADVAELMAMAAHHEGTTPAAFLDAWNHDEPGDTAL